jgi:gas vesicle protein
LSCEALEVAYQQKEEELRYKDQTIKKLQQTIEDMKKNHKRELEELKLTIEQKIYIAHKDSKVYNR